MLNNIKQVIGKKTIGKNTNTSNNININIVEKIEFLLIKIIN